MRDSNSSANSDGATLLERVFTLRSVPQHIVLVTAMASYGSLVLAAIAGWPVWALVIAAVVPWAVIFSAETVWTYRHFHWLALFYVLVATQGGHFIEHTAQMVQIHVLDQAGPEARGIFGRLDIEWVHFGWNTWVLVAVVALLLRYRLNPWLWVTLVIAGWHELEHAYLVARYVATGLEGNPGLLADGGRLGGGLGLSRPDLHFYYNVVETLPLFAAFAWTLKHVHDEWLARALPNAEPSVLVDATQRATTARYAADEVIVRQGEIADRFYVIVRGEAQVSGLGEAGDDVDLGRLGPGQFFGEIGLLSDDPAPRTATVKAATDVEVLTLDRRSFRDLVAKSRETEVDLARVAAARLRARLPDVAEASEPELRRSG